MVPYQMYQALTGQRTRELVAAAKRRQMLVADRDSMDTTGSTSPLKDLAAALASRLSVGRRGRARRTATPTSGAGPIGCAT